MIELTYPLVYLYIFVACGIGLLYGIYNWANVLSIKTDGSDLDEEGRDKISQECINIMNETSVKIQEVLYYIK
jgi:hypothetical protein